MSRAEKFRFVCATRETRARFATHTALGRSLALFEAPFVELVLFEENATGLPVLYNRAIASAASDPAILIFVHDDVHLCDFCWPLHLTGGLRTFDVIGVAGSRRRAPRQPSWNYVDEHFTREARENLSGIVAHGKGFPPDNVTGYGPPCQAVKLLDGVLLAVRSDTLLAKGIEFDPRFAFHFYDMDFCRQAERAGLRLGTWTLSVIHESAGQFDTPAWRAAYASYLEKWGS